MRSKNRHRCSPNAIRAIRLSIQRALQIKPVQVVLVTSAIDDEGKTTLRSTSRFRSQHSASAPCWSIATCAIRRRPIAARRALAVGLLQVALGKEPIERAITVNRGSGLSVLPAPVNAYSYATSELMFSERIDAVFGPCVSGTS